ncbi:hypothetical protein IFM89_013304 [Coptis chinensis]|uniref:SNARE-complex protein Syntaxin-18 N-terminal domain-containing protein n=1 Tax=Coptis chinensis TaxID=261450 RepID=A0A835HE95_9MAGN|nr:hypothetical protein IFM89_013304 [Coptis chinensis]
MEDYEIEEKKQAAADVLYQYSQFVMVSIGERVRPCDLRLHLMKEISDMPTSLKGATSKAGASPDIVAIAMSRSRDRTEDFKDTVRSVAVSLGYDESKTASILASFIMHKPRQKSPFTKASLKTLESIEALEQFIVKHRKDYVDLHRTTEQERDSIEHEIIVFIRACKEQIDILQSRIHDEEKSGNQKTWLGTRGDGSRADIVAHKHGVVC